MGGWECQHVSKCAVLRTSNMVMVGIPQFAVGGEVRSKHAYVGEWSAEVNVHYHQIIYRVEYCSGYSRSYQILHSS